MQRNDALRRSRQSAVVAAAALVLTIAAGCGAAPSQASGPNASGTGLPTGPAAPPSPALTSTSDADSSPDPSAAPESVRVAVRALTAYCQPDASQQRWLDGLTPYLTQDAAPAYGTVDPARIPCSAVQGAGRAVDGDAAFTMRVAADTDAGTYTVWLSRRGQGRPWRLDRFVPLERR